MAADHPALVLMLYSFLGDMKESFSSFIAILIDMKVCTKPVLFF